MLAAALWGASTPSRRRSTQLLIEAGADGSAQDDEGWTALELAE